MGFQLIFESKNAKKKKLIYFFLFKKKKKNEINKTF